MNSKTIAIALVATVMISAALLPALFSPGVNAETAEPVNVTIAPGMKYTWKPTYPGDLNPTTTILKQGIGTQTNGTWGTLSGGTLVVTVPSSATAGTVYNVTLRATTTNPAQTYDMPIVFNVRANMTVSGSHGDIVTGSSVSMTPTVDAMGTVTWAVTSGKTLPAGLSLAPSTGKVTGTPTGMGPQTIYLTATSSYGETANLTVSFKIVSKLIPTNSPTAGAIIYVV